MLIFRWVCFACLGMLSVVASVTGNEAEGPYFWLPGLEEGTDVLPLKETDIDVNIVGILAEVKVTQVYANVGDVPIEAVYMFPGSTRAAVNGLEMRIGDRVVRADIQEKKQAKRTYENAVRQGKTASLLEQHRPNVFQMKVGNILPGDVIEVELQYTEWVPSEAGEYEFVYPMVVGPRYGAGGASEGSDFVRNPYVVDAQGDVIQTALRVRLNAGVPIESIKCETHEADFDFEGENAAWLELDRENGFHGNRDFVMKYRVSGDAVQSALLMSEGEEGRDNYFLAMVQPPQRKFVEALPPREYVFVLDVSGSMNGFPMQVAGKLMEDLLVGLDERDFVNVLMFAGGSAVLSERSLPATEANKMKALSFVGSAEGGGGTNLLPALERVLEMENGTGLSRNVVIVTDGYVAVEAQAFDLIREGVGEANFFTFGIGTGVNRHLIEGMARVGKSEAFVVMHEREAYEMADRFRDYISCPVLTDVELGFEGLEVFDVEPLGVPDLLAERPIFVFGKWRGNKGGTIIASGLSGNGEYVERLRVEDAVDLAGSRALEYVWARERIRRLSDYNSLQLSDERVSEITRLGLTHSLLTKYTSFVAVDEVVRRGVEEDLETVKQPLPLPKGVSKKALSHQSVPVTPEPGAYALMAMVAGMLFLFKSKILSSKSKGRGSKS